MEEYIIELFKDDKIDDICFKNYIKIFDLLFSNDKSFEFAKKVLDIIIDNCLKYIIDYDSMINDFLIVFEDEEGTYNKLYDYIDKRFSDIVNNINAAALTTCDTEISRKRKLINDALNRNFDQNLEEIIKYKIFSILKVKKYDEIDINFIKHLFKELLEYEHKQLSDIHFTRGLYSSVHIIGDKVFKIGKRETFRIKSDRRYLKPLLRKQIKIGKNTFCFEITERVSNDVTLQDAEIIIAELEKRGKIWEDSGVENIGRLIKPNKVYFKYPMLGDNGYIDTPESSIILPAGEIVIIDNDFIYDNKEDYAKIYK